MVLNYRGTCEEDARDLNGRRKEIVMNIYLTSLHSKAKGLEDLGILFGVYVWCVPCP